MNENNNTGIYIRVSTEEQAKDGFSINAQKEKLTKYAEANGWTIYDYYIDDGVSGKDLIKRPEVNRLLDDLKNKRINNVLIYKLDRLTRSVRDLIYLIELFEKYKCTFNSQTEKIDTSNAVGRMFIKIIGIFAEFERENLAERVAFGYEQKTREGNYTNTNGVYGYNYISGEQKLIVNEEEKELVNTIFDLYINGNSYYKIANLFNSKNVSTKRGGHWSASTIKSIINNPLYIGKVRYGLGKNKKDKTFTVDGKNIDAIIDTDKWNLANKIVKTREKYIVRRYPNENSYFYHTIKCGNCGGSISARNQTQNGKTYVTYRCNNSYKGICKSGGFSHKKMEMMFVNYLDKLNNMVYASELSNVNESISNYVVNIRLNWEYLNNKERQLFLERFVNYIEVVNMNNNIAISSVAFN